MQQELGRDGVPVAARAAGPTVVLVSAGLLLAALGAAAVLLFPVVEEVRCLGFWDDGTKVAISPATRVDACRWLERSPCYPAGFSDQAPVRHGPGSSAAEGSRRWWPTAFPSLGSCCRAG
jgi:hypothetical protein